MTKRQLMPKGEYERIHNWIRNKLGKASKCNHCTKPSKRYEWALKQGKEYDYNTNIVPS